MEAYTFQSREGIPWTGENGTKLNSQYATTFGSWMGKFDITKNKNPKGRRKGKEEQKTKHYLKAQMYFELQIQLSKLKKQSLPVKSFIALCASCQNNIQLYDIRECLDN